jgi:hypothetical protein
MRGSSLPASLVLIVSASALRMSTWSNAAFGGEPTSTSTVADITVAALSWPATSIFSVELQGTLTPPAGGSYDVECSFVGGSGFIWLDDHCVCQGGNDPATWGDYIPQTIVPFNHAQGVTLNRTLFLRMTFQHGAANNTAGAPRPSVSMSWSALPVPSPTPTPPPPTPAMINYLGCYVDDTNGKRDLPYNAGDLKTTNSPAACSAECFGWKYFGLQDGTNCFCGNRWE